MSLGRSPRTFSPLIAGRVRKLCDSAGVADILVVGLLAGVTPETAGRWLAHAEPTVAALDSELWPESILREETLAVLGIENVNDLLEGVQPLDPAAALTQAVA